MKKLRLKVVLSIFAIFFIFLTPVLTFAQNSQQINNAPVQTQQINNQIKTFTLQNPLKVNSIGGLVQSFVEIFSYIAILFAVLILIYVGLRFILARGNVEEMKKLKDWLLWIVVGVVIVIGARVIVQVVINTLSASGTIDQGVINSTNNALYGR